jgi:transcriptional regulator with PAS, ATPase and Fis domain
MPGVGSEGAARVLVLVHRGKERVIALPASGRVSIGRGPDNDVVIPEALVSRRHAVLHVTGDQLSIEDLASENGTRLLGRDDTTGAGHCRTATHTRRAGVTALEAGRAAPFRVGATLQIGTCLLSVTRAAVAAAAPAAADLAIADPHMRDLHAQLERAAPTDINVLLLGETGAGKEVFASRLHQLSSRAAGPFIKINCGAIVESLLESELFGHEKGAFTGAAAPKPGLFEAAARGTVFLDELGELPLGLQVKLLRVLEERAVTRIGALRARPIDVRFVAATNVDLEAAVTAGRFRRDLYYRINSVCLTIPPLRERRGEIEPLARLFIAQLAVAHGRRPAPILTEAALRRMREAPWPGNIRELRNAIERAVVLATGQVIDEDDLPLASCAPPPPAAPPAAGLAPGSGAGTPDDLRRRAAQAERDELLRALAAAAGNQTRAAGLLGITRRALIVRLDRHGVARPRRRG